MHSFLEKKNLFSVLKIYFQQSFTILKLGLPLEISQLLLTMIGHEGMWIGLIPGLSVASFLHNLRLRLLLNVFLVLLKIKKLLKPDFTNVY